MNPGIRIDGEVRRRKGDTLAPTPADTTPKPGPEDPAHALVVARGMSPDEVDRRTCFYAGRWWMISPCPGCGGWLGVLLDPRSSDRVTWICAHDAFPDRGGEGQGRISLLEHLFWATGRDGALLELILRMDPSQLQTLGASEFGPIPLRTRRTQVP